MEPCLNSGLKARTQRSQPVILGLLVVSVGFDLIPIGVRYDNWEAFAWAGGGALIYLSASFSLAQLAIAGAPGQQSIQRIVTLLLARGGTRWDRADLSAAHFSQADLRQTSFRCAKLMHTQFHRAQGLNEANVNGTLLQDARVRQLLVSHRGHCQSFSGCDLNHVYLAYADLERADLSHCKLNGAILEGARLEYSNLSQTQVLGADLRRTKLTGACLEGWNIDNQTRLEGSECDFIDLAQQQQEQRPRAGQFIPGDFEALFRQMVDTLDLIFQTGVDWQALSRSL